MKESKIESELFSLRRVVIVLGAIVGVFVVSIVGFVLLILRSASIEEYCSREAHKIVGNRWSELLELNEEEKRNPLFATSYGKISRGFREQLKCEREQKFFYLF